MALLEDLNDNLMLMILDQLSPNQLMEMRLNRRLRRLANDKLLAKTAVIIFSIEECLHEINFQNECHDIDPIARDKLVLWSMANEEVVDDVLQSPSEQAAFLNLFSICSRVKSIDFGCFKFSDGFLLEVVRRCPELECINLNMSMVQEDDWDQALEEIGPKLVHFSKKNGYLTAESDLRLFDSVAKKCPNIKRVEWLPYILDGDLLLILETLPKNCWIKLKCLCEDYIEDFNDVIDELDSDVFDLNLLDGNVKRLSSLRVVNLNTNDDVEDVEFPGLKRLDFQPFKYNEDSAIKDSIKCLVATRFPSLEVLVLDINGCSQDDYHQLFQNMPSLKVLTVCLNLQYEDLDCELPLLPSISQPKNLETINLMFKGFPEEDWQPDELLQQVEEYVDHEDEIVSLKKVVVDMSLCNYYENWEEHLRNEVERIDLKQVRVDIKLVCEGSTRESYFKIPSLK